MTKFAEFTYQEDKRCMLARLKFGADFSVGVCAPRNATAHSYDPPHLQHERTGVLLLGLRPEEDHAPLYRGRHVSLGNTSSPTFGE